MTTTSTPIFDESELEAFRNDGYLVVRADDHHRSLIPRDVVEEMSARQRALTEAMEKKPHMGYFTMIEKGVMFSDNGGNCFRTAAMHSKLPQAAAELMGLANDDEDDDATSEDNGKTNLRVLRDVLLAKDIDEKGCNWHVDDQSFWPESFQQTDPSIAESINVWIALDDMPAQYRGSMALATGSHKVEWREEAYQALGQDRNEDGGRTKEGWIDFFQKAKQAGQPPFLTCSLDLTRPDLRDKFEQSRQVIDLKRGDIIFATRSLFHKTDDVTEEGKEYYRSKKQQTLGRYSIRYSPGTARLPIGWVSEWSCATNEEAAGQPLNDIERITGKPWYPVAWPKPEPDMEERMTAQDLEHAKMLLKEQGAKFMALIK